MGFQASEIDDGLVYAAMLGISIGLRGDYLIGVCKKVANPWRPKSKKNPPAHGC